jgi:chitinase
MNRRWIVLVLGALACAAAALLGVQPSGATWTDTSSTTAQVSAAVDWTPPSVRVSDPGASVTGNAVAITATASDTLSPIASTTIEYAPAGSSTWTALTACSSAGSSPVTRSCTWDTTAGVPDGSYDLRAVAVDSVGNSSTSALVRTVVANDVRVTLTRLPAYVRGIVAVRGDLASGVVPGTQLFLQYLPSGGAWTQLTATCSSMTATVRCDWSTAALPDGVYAVRVLASTGQTDTQTGIAVDNTGPAVPTLTAPTGVLGGSVTLAASVAQDSPAGIASLTVQYRLTGAAAWIDCGTSSALSYSCPLVTTGLANGSYELWAVATDRAGNVTASSPITRTIDNTPATVAFGAPSNGATVDGTVTVSGTAQSPRGITGLRIEYGQAGSYQTLCTPGPAASFSCSWNTVSLPAGRYDLRAVLSQTSGGDVTTSITANVAHPPGTVAITSPAAGAVLTQGTATISGTAAAGTGVSQVQVRVAPVNPAGTTTTLTCTPSSGAFTCPAWDLQSVAYGTYALTAQMTQGNNVVVASTPVNVTVDRTNAAVSLDPVPGTIRGTAVLTATASSRAGVSAVRFEATSAGGTTTTLCNVTAPSGGKYSCTWNTAAITYGAYTVRAVLVQGSGAPQLASAAQSTTVDNRVLAGSDVRTVNGGVAGLLDRGDQIVFQYTGVVKADTIQAGLTYGASSAVGITLTGTPGSAADTLTIDAPGLGTFSAGARFIKNNTSTTYAGSTIRLSLGQDAQGNAVTIVTVTLGQPGSTADLQAVNSPVALSWTPAATATDLFGNACATTLVSRSGSL